jgi:predicted transcriptional regulator
MVEQRSLSKGELAIARLLWEHGPASVRQIFEAQSGSKPMDFTTVQTYLRRLEQKEYANSTLEGRIRIYSARTRPRTVIRETVNDLVERLFGGETMPLVRHLIEERGIDEAEIAELRKLIDKLEQGGGR